MKAIIDRFEGDFAVLELEDKNILNINKNKIPKEAKEGDILRIENDYIVLDNEEREKLKKEIEEITKDVWVE